MFKKSFLTFARLIIPLSFVFFLNAKAADPCMAMTDKADCFVSQLNFMFKTSVKVIPAEYTHAGAGNVYLSAEDRTLVRDQLYFLLAHEYSHIILDGSDNYMRVASVLARYIQNDLAFSKEEIKNEMFLQIGHENIDALAAKIIREFDVDISISAAWFDLAASTLPNNETSEIFYLKKYLRKRKMVTINSYNEGWNNWSNYRYNAPICDEGLFQTFLKDRGYNKILSILKPDEMKYNIKLQEIYDPNINKCIFYDYDRIINETNKWKDLFN